MADPPANDRDFFATCPRNTEGLLLAELRSLGASNAVETRAGVGFGGTTALAYKACLWSRVASRVLMRLAAFPLSSLDELYETVIRLPWEDHVAVSGTLAVEVTSTVRRGPLAQVNTHFAEQRVKDAVVDRFRAATGGRPAVDLTRPDIRINVHLAPSEATVSLDLSGDGLHRRGYRLESGGAPLKENLAAAILLRAGWPAVAADGGALVDPMCGSGTLLIEGAMLAGDVAPGLLRDYYGFLGWKSFDPVIWHDLLAEARERREVGLKSIPPLFGFDIDEKAVNTARANARRAGLAGRIHLERLALAEAAGPFRVTSTVAESGVTGTGLLVTNPPYGKRIGEVPQLVETYETLGKTLKTHFRGWEAAIFTGEPELGAHLGLRAHRVNVLYNGPLECRLLLFHVDQSRRPQVTSPAAPPSAGAQMFENRLRKNLKHLRRWIAREDIHCYRAYDADLPDYAFAVDVYEDWAHVQEYAPPSTVDPVRARRRSRETLTVVSTVLEIPPERVVAKVRQSQRGASQYQRMDVQDRLIQVREGGLRFWVNLTCYLDTGLFLDHRATRQMIRELAHGKRFLNLFAYTGSATVYAAAGGAAATTTVDLSLTYLDWARRNMDSNEFTGSQHSYIRADCVEWLRQEDSGTKQVFDLIFLDAPTFSNSKSMSATLDIQRDHAELIRSAVRLLTSEGILLFSANYRRFKLDAGLASELDVTDITDKTIPPDFVRNRRIHTCFRIARPAPAQTGRSPVLHSSGAGGRDGD